MTIETRTERIYNFSAGPAVLPLPALEEAQRHLLALPGVGASVLEISHRSRHFAVLLEETEERLRRLLAIPSDYRVLFLQGGATLQFAMAPLNFMGAAGADYVESGSWAGKAIQEARKFGRVEVAWSGRSEGYVRMPEPSELHLREEASFLHFTSNETIQGIEMLRDPEVPLPVVCDASSDLLCRPLAVGRYDLIYAGAQKNLGPAGVTVVILSERLLSRQVGENLPTMLDYRRMAEGKSVYNTPPVFAIYMVGLVLRWVEELGGLEAVYERNRRKAEIVYRAIDESGGFYRGHARPSSRSLMNVTFRLPSEELEKRFVTEAEKQGMMGLTGHRSVGGIRASMYNAFPPEGAELLAEFMGEFRERYG